MNRIVPLILAIALFMEQMDSTVISTSLPAIAHDIGVGPITLKLALTSYMVALAIFIPLSGWMADRFGAKRIFRAAILVFIVGSVLCAISNSLIAFVLSRFLQGMGGAMMTPVARLVLVRGAPRSELVSAMALLTIPALVGPLAGPPLGGFITTYFSWHWIFLINVPVGIAGYVLSGIYLPEMERRNPPPVDILGFLLGGIAASGIVFGLSVISLPALPTSVGIASVSAGIAATFLYIVHARRHPAPVLDLKLFRNSAFRAATIGGTIFRISVGAIPFLMPLMLQIGFGLNPFESGLITFVGAIGAITTKFLARRVLAFAGFRTTLIAAAVVGGVMTFANSFFTPATPYLLMISILLIAGFARSFFFTSINALSFAEIDDADASKATSMSAVLQQISLALGVAVAGAILEIQTSISGGPLNLEDFHIAFMIIAGANLLAAIPFLTMAKNAGASVSGHRLQMREVETTAGK
ncbi:DHA2 family efflux MFS transporter permease subunit [Sinorhizobium terangae]|uniref:DHA2 family efflux MFS transporter permease subunit n=1 Tax=Sinorhizobium terangae TaxID=110322 RepID=A0A6N7LC80_SINTE|nr:DHA2 family efflux MFS transporter permease subunit [Sinorhizobium terangae]MBB4184085.1 EmrB/QacA subfamily drug resistance transporter [Sinorhizobium terangae]MQX14900.1 DHA2 family efflux MFS transporter permease subunit [Sinorhizobium terangae]WFU48185.1 DHA2 family efflux MFS transporter permease subunit [Sinorhizobium terangae]